MGERLNALDMTVHLLASSGDVFLLQQILDNLFRGLWPDIQLFLVSERITSITYFERNPKKTSGFPGMSVLLFLHEDLGENRIIQTLNLFQHPPWQYHHIANAHGKPCPYMLVGQDFYSLDTHMPVWGVRQVHYGTEILRVTLYCSFENYEDAVRLYETILQRDATVQKSSFCFFVLYSNENMSVQLSLKQMPEGVTLEVKESSVLQFKVQEIGELVPLLPNPCIPISNTRWQTQDYDGNKILLQVRGSSSEKQAFLPHHQKNTTEESNLQILRQYGPSQFPSRDKTDRQHKDLFYMKADPKNWRFPTRKHQSSEETSDHSESLTSESAYGTPRSGSFSSSHCSSPTISMQCPVQFKTGSSGREKPTQAQEEETNVDTGFTVVLSECSPSPLHWFSKDLYNNIPSHSTPTNGSTREVGSRIKSPCENVPHNSFCAANTYKGLGASELNAQPAHKNHVNGVEDEEEFFI